MVACTPHFLYMKLYVLRTSYAWNHVTFALLCLAYFTEHNVFKVHLVEIHKFHFSSHGWMLFHCMYITWRSLTFLDLQSHVFHQSWEVWSHYFFKYFSAPLSLSLPSWTPTVHMLIYLMVFHGSFGLCSLFFALFSFCSSDLIILIVLPSLLLFLFV